MFAVYEIALFMNQKVHQYVFSVGLIGIE